MSIVAFSPLYPHFLQLVRLLIHREKMFRKPKPKIEWWREGRKEWETKRAPCEEKHYHRNSYCSKSPHDKDNQKEPAHFAKLYCTFLALAVGRLPCTFLLLCHCFTYPTQKTVEQGIGGNEWYQVFRYTYIQLYRIQCNKFDTYIPSFCVTTYRVFGMFVLKQKLSSFR